MMQPLARALAAADAAAAVETMAEDVTLHVAVHPEPFQGRPATAHFLGAVLDGPLHDIEIGETIEGQDSALLMFSSQVAGYDGRAEGLLVARTEVDGDGRISELTVFLRPLAGLAALAEEMGRRLGGPRPDGLA